MKIKNNKEINKKSKKIIKTKKNLNKEDFKIDSNVDFNKINRKFAKRNLIQKLLDFQKIESFYSQGTLRILDEKVFVGIFEGEIIFYDFIEHKIINKIKIENEEICVFEINHSKNLIYFVTVNGILREMELSSFSILKDLKLYKFTANNLLIDSNDKILILCDPKGEFKVIRIEDFKTFFEIKNNFGLLQIDLNKINNVLYLIVLTREREILFYDFIKMKIKHKIKTEDTIQFSSFKIFNEIKRLYASGFDNKIYIFSLKNFKLLKSFDIDCTINKIEIIKIIDYYLILLKENGKFDIYFIKKKGDLVYTNTYLNQNNHSLEDILISKEKLFFLSEEREIFEFVIKNNELELKDEFISYNDEVLDLKFINYNFLIIVTNSDIFRIVNLKNNKSKIIRGHKEIIICCETYQNRILTGSKDNIIILWNIQILGDNIHIEKVNQFKGHFKDIISLCFLHQDKNYFWSGSLDNSVKLWKIKENKDNKENVSEKNIIAHNKDMNSVKVSPNDKFFATCSHDRTVKLFNLKKFELITEFKGHKRGIWDIEFNKVEKNLLSCSGDETIRIWCLENFECLSILEGHTSSLLKIKILNYGLQLISTGNDGSIKLWNLKKGIIIDSYEKNEGRIWAADMIEDDIDILKEEDYIKQDIPEFRLVTGDNSGNIIIWQNYTEELKIKDLEFKQNNEIKLLEINNLLKKNDFEKASMIAFDNGFKKKFILSLLSLDKLLNNESEYLYNINLDQTYTKDFSIKYEILNNIIKHCLNTNFNLLMVILRDYNTSNKYASITQLIMRFLFKNIKINEYINSKDKMKIENLGKSIETNNYFNTIKNYSIKHLDRFEGFYKDIISFDKIIEKYGIIN